MISEVSNTKLYESLSLLEPEYYYRKTPPSYREDIKNQWRALLTEFSIKFHPIIYHRYKKAGKEQDRIDLENANKDILRIYPEPVKIILYKPN